jgi:hypothetical protein
MPNELPPEQLRRSCDPQQFSFETTAELPLIPDIIGQPRATRAIEFGLDMEGPGYNIFVLGPGGTGRTTTIQRFLAQRAAQEPTPDDWVYVHNFSQPRSPRAIRLPPGLGARFRDDMAALVAQLRQTIPRAFESETYQEARRQIEQRFQEAQETLLRELDAQARQRSFAVVRAPSGLAIVPLKDGRPLPQEAFQALPEEEREQYAAMIPGTGAAGGGDRPAPSGAGGRGPGGVAETGPGGGGGDGRPRGGRTEGPLRRT